MKYAPFDPPVLRMITAQDMKGGRPVVSTIAPQVHFTEHGDLCISVLNQDSSEPTPSLNSYIVPHSVLQMKANETPQQNRTATSVLQNDTFKQNINDKIKPIHRARASALHSARLQQHQRDRILHQAHQTASTQPSVNVPDSSQSPESELPSDSPEPSSPIHCGMISAQWGPLSGAVYNTSLNPVDANAVQGRRPNRAEHFRQQDRHTDKPAAPNPYFYSPESRVGNASFVLTFASLVQLVKNPKFTPFIDALQELIDKTPAVDKAAIVALTFALMNMASECNIPISCTVDSQPLQSGGGKGVRKRKFSCEHYSHNRLPWTETLCIYSCEP